MAITLYTGQTPNGVKISIALELLRLAYKTVHIDITTNKQKEEWYLKICPNGRIPAIVDTEGPRKTNGEEFTIFEGGAILQYLADKYDTQHRISFPRHSEEYYRMLEWLYFQHGGIGPMQGQAHHFSFYAKENIPYGIKRYTDETHRLYTVLNTQLEKNGTGFIVGDHISLADIATVGWVAGGYKLGFDLKKEFPAIDNWISKVVSIEEVKKGINVPTPWPHAEHYKL